jgi:hypothetical protein
MDDLQRDHLFFLLESILKTNLYKLNEKDLNSAQRKEIRWITEKLNQ